MDIHNDILLAGKSTVYSLFYSQVRRNQNVIAIEYQGKTWTYAEIDEAVRCLAAVFKDYGIVKEDRVAILSENRPEYIVAELACAMIGAIIACQNWRLSIDELNHCINLVNPRLILVSERFTNNLNKLNVDFFKYHII